MFLLEKDALNGKSGKAFLIKNGENIEMFGLKKFESNAEFQTADFNVVGTNITQKKVKGVTMTGSATVYYGTPVFLEMLSEYLKTDRLPYFIFQITNDDQGTSIGRQVVALYNVKLDKVPIALLDDSADYLTAEITFSFTGMEVLEGFKRVPDQLG